MHMHSLWASLGLDTLWSAVLIGTLIRSDVFWFRWQSVKAVWHGFQEARIQVKHAKTSILKPREAIHQALTLFGEVRFITWCPFLGKC